MSKRIITYIVTAIFLITNIFSFCSFAEIFVEDTGVFEDEGNSIETIKSQDEPKSIFELQSRSVLLMDAATGQVLFLKNPHEKLPPASVTKIMSILLFMEAIDSGRTKWDEKVSCSEYAAGMGGSQIYLEPGEQMTVDELMKSVVVASGNDATVALAEHIYGSEENFVNLMNEKAKQLGMKDTNFVNTTGLDADNHVTTAYDIALMSRELVNKHPSIHKYMSIWMDTVRNGEFGLANTNKLVRFYRGCDGIKTGSTSKAMFCVSETAVRNGLRLIAVIMAAPSSKVRFAEASKLLDHGFANYSSVLVGKKGDVYGTVKVAKGIKSELDCIIPEDTKLLVKKGEERNTERIVSLNGTIKAPVKKGQKIGEIILKTNNKAIGKIDLVASQSIDKVNCFNIYSAMLAKWYSVGR
ncbi:MAG: D-alanyl-D-alanine carboxypeptidase family protein [Deltaproteobacteria bacterium]